MIRFCEPNHWSEGSSQNQLPTVFLKVSLIGIGYFWQSFTIVHCLLVAKSHLIKAKLHHFISLNVYYFIWDNKFYQFLNCLQAIKYFQVTSYQMIYFHVNG